MTATMPTDQASASVSATTNTTRAVRHSHRLGIVVDLAGVDGVHGFEGEVSMSRSTRSSRQTSVSWLLSSRDA